MKKKLFLDSRKYSLHAEEFLERFLFSTGLGRVFFQFYGLDLFLVYRKIYIYLRMLFYHTVVPSLTHTTNCFGVGEYPGL